MSAEIKKVIKNGLAYKAGLKSGDVIHRINNIPVEDILDIMYLSCDSRLEIELDRGRMTIKNDEYENLGVEFETMLIDKPRPCANKCIFCFIDQLPDGMRESMYFKDDDYRLSFLQGNYITLTNLTEKCVKKIINYRLPRLNISVHTTNPELRKTMLNNKKAGEILSLIQKFSENGITMNCQIVLVRGVNDGEELDRTLTDLSLFKESIESTSVVPVGLTKFRAGLPKLLPYDKEAALKVIKQTEKYERVYAADEFYLTAEAEIPHHSHYGDFWQIENGVGMIADFKHEFKRAASEAGNEFSGRKMPTAIVTGVLAEDFLRNMLKDTPFADTEVYAVRNDYFGHSVTVAGLVTGRDIINQLKGKAFGKRLLVPACMLKQGEEIFLDDTTIEEIEKELSVKVTVVANRGSELWKTLCVRG